MQKHAVAGRIGTVLTVPPSKQLITHQVAMPRALTTYHWSALDLKKCSDRSPGPVSGTWVITDLEKLTGLEENVLRQWQTRKQFSPNNLLSVAMFLARHGKSAIREALVRQTVVAAPKRTTSPDSLRSAVEWLAAYGTIQTKHKILRSALGAARKKRAKVGVSAKKR